MTFAIPSRIGSAVIVPTAAYSTDAQLNEINIMKDIENSQVIGNRDL